MSSEMLERMMEVFAEKTRKSEARMEELIRGLKEESPQVNVKKGNVKPELNAEDTDDEDLTELTKRSRRQMKIADSKIYAESDSRVKPKLQDKYRIPAADSEEDDVKYFKPVYEKARDTKGRQSQKYSSRKEKFSPEDYRDDYKSSVGMNSRIPPFTFDGKSDWLTFKKKFTLFAGGMMMTVCTI